MSLLFNRTSKLVSEETAIRKSELAIFSHQYEQLVELLLGAAQFGTDDLKENLYRNLKSYLGEAYPKIRPSILAFLKFSVTDAETCLRMGAGFGDAFQALWAGETLAQVIEEDGGDLADRLYRTSLAVEHYSKFLERLSQIESEDDPSDH